MLLEITSHSQLRIGMCISMIILLLGIISVFSIGTMEEINQNFNYLVEYEQKISSLENIKIKYEKQNTLFEKLITEKNQVSTGSFWIYSTEIKNEFLDLNEFVTGDLKTNHMLTEKEHAKLQRDILSYYELHLTYENTGFRAINHFHEGEQLDFLQEYNNLKYLQLEIHDKINEIEQTLQIISTSSKFSLDNSIDNFQTLQFTIIFLIGIITTVLVFFLNRNNINLKIEIKSQTTSLQKLNEKLMSMDKKRAEFISIASHELKGPLQPIFGFVELAKTGIISNQEAMEGISNIASHMENIANNVLDLTKIENNELELHLEKCSINNIIQEVVNSEHFNPERKVPIKIEFDKDIWLNLDKTRIKQVIRNILDNCIKFTESGEIKIRTQLMKEDKTLKLYFTDTGPEIPKEVLPKIFEKFVTKSHDKVSGFGLGLYISKKIIDAHNGEIVADNKKGQPIFEITLPLVAFGINKKSHE